MLKEFKKFILTGNVIDLAIAVILAGAVGGVVKGFVSMVMMTVIGMFTGGINFKDVVIELSPGTESVIDEAGTVLTAAIPANNILIGSWIDTIINLIIVGFVLFMIVKAANKMKKKEEAKPVAPSGPTKEEVLLGEIRDLSKK